MMYNVLDWTLTQAITRLEKKGTCGRLISWSNLLKFDSIAHCRPPLASTRDFLLHNNQYEY